MPFYGRELGVDIAAAIRRAGLNPAVIAIAEARRDGFNPRKTPEILGMTRNQVEAHDKALQRARARLEADLLR